MKLFTRALVAEVTLDTDVKFGTIFNTVAGATKLEGTIGRKTEPS